MLIVACVGVGSGRLHCPGRTFQTHISASVSRWILGCRSPLSLFEQQVPWALPQQLATSPTYDQDRDGLPGLRPMSFDAETSGASVAVVVLVHGLVDQPFVGRPHEPV